MSIPCLQVDAFADRPFAGNPAAVCLLETDAETDWMQSVALEMNLSETAFVRKANEGFDLRWFTPAIEVDLCGHATLASAHVLWSEGIVNTDAAIRFHTRSGTLTCAQDGPLIELDFPATPPTETDCSLELQEALGIKHAEFTGKSAYDKIVLVDSETTLRSLQPDFNQLSQIDVRGVIVTAQSDSAEFDFVSRFFAPAAGVNEDPATGSAHCCLGPFWQQRLGKSEMIGFQASQRGGVIRVRVVEDRVRLAGKAFTMLKGELVC